MAVIAKRFFLGRLTGTETQLFVGLGRVGQGLNTRARMGAVTKRLVLAAAATAPPIGFAGFNGNENRVGFRNQGFFSHKCPAIGA